MAMKICPVKQAVNCKPISFKHNSNAAICVNETDILRLKNRFETKAKLREKNGNLITGYIVKESGFVGPCAGAEKFKLIANSSEYCYMVIHKDRGDNALYISELYADKNKKKSTRGAGSEMLKFAARKSMERGFEGRLNLKAAGMEYPCVFYYKNNLRTKLKTQRVQLDAAMDYCARTNDSFSRIKSSDDIAVPMHLDKNNARALLDERKIYLERNSRKIGEANLDIKDENGNIENREFIIDFADLNDNSAVIQLIDKNANTDAQFALIELIRENKNEAYTVKNTRIPSISEYHKVKGILYSALENI